MLNIYSHLPKYHSDLGILLLLKCCKNCPLCLRGKKYSDIIEIANKSIHSCLFAEEMVKWPKLGYFIIIEETFSLVNGGIECRKILWWKIL